MEIKTVGIVGHGAFGALVRTLIQRFAPGIEVRVFSREQKPDGKTFFSLEETAVCDAVVLAVPIHAFEEVLVKVVPLLGEKSVLVDVATVKVHTTNLLKKIAAGKRYLATHPMWGPQSFEKRGGDISGFRIVMTDGTLEVAEYAALTDFLRKCGFDVVEMSAEAHDKRLAETLFLAHLVGQTIVRGGFERTDIDTVSFGFLMDAVESVRHDEALFRDVFRFNPYCKEVLQRFERGESSVRALLEERKTVGASSGVIGVSGAQGSFSEEAARAYADRSGMKKFSLAYLVSVENVLSALEQGEIELGVFPIENSTGGVVNEAINAMGKHRFEIQKTFAIDIHQNLLVRSGVARDKIKAIVSHEQALRQCSAYLKSAWPNVEAKEYEDTAKAAEDLASGKLPASTAVIASKGAAKLYGLDILEESIQDLKSNFTTFLAVTSA